MATSATATTNPNANGTDSDAGRQRDAQGRFTKGNPGGPGNPFARQTAKLRQAVVNALTDADMHELVDILKKKAREGDVAAIKLLLSYGVGRPTIAENPDTLDQQELGIIHGNHTNTSEALLDIIQRLPVELVLRILHLGLPKLCEGKKAMANQVFQNPPVPTEYEPDDDDDDDEDDEDENLEDSEPSTAAAPSSTPKPAEKPQANPPGQDPNKAREDEQVLRKLRDRFRPPSTNGANGHRPRPKKDNDPGCTNGKHPRPPMTNGSNGRKR